MGTKQWKYRRKFEDGEKFVLREVNSDKKNRTRAINFWHEKGDNVLFFTFFPNDVWNKACLWDREMMEKLEADLKSPNPTVKVKRFAYNENLIFKEDGYAEQIPKIPPVPSEQDDQGKCVRKEKGKRLQIEKEKTKEPAPYIVYAKHDECEKEFAWRLYPDKPKRQGIVPGDRVVVWTQRGFKDATVMRIEEAGDKEQPNARVKKKLE